jgi:hypothetical protein
MTERVLRWPAGLVVVAAALVAGVGPAADKVPAGEPQEKPKAVPAKPAPVLKPGKPSAHGLREVDLEVLRTILQNAVGDKGVPGVALLLARKGEIVFKEAFGDLKADEPVKMASDTKQARRFDCGDGHRGPGQDAPRRSADEICAGV